MGKRETPGARGKRSHSPVRFAVSSSRPGDGGKTLFPSVGRVAKDHPGIAVLGDLDELNCALGEIVARLKRSRRQKASDAVRSLERVQRELFVLGAIVCGSAKDMRQSGDELEVMVRQLDEEIRAAQSQLPPCRRFILPGGDLAGSAAHLARAVCRRVERNCVAAGRAVPAVRLMLPYLNRLGEWLFVLARRLNAAIE